MKRIELTDEQYDILVAELQSLSSYHWNDDTKHASECGSVAITFIEGAVETVDDKEIEAAGQKSWSN